MTQQPNRNEAVHDNKGRSDRSYRKDMEFGSSKNLSEAEKHQSDRKTDINMEAPKYPTKSASAS